MHLFVLVTQNTLNDGNEYDPCYELHNFEIIDLVRVFQWHMVFNNYEKCPK